jgi:ribonuclease HI
VTQVSLFADAPGPQARRLMIFCDGGARGNPGPAAIGAVVLDATSDPPQRLATVSECIGETTNNVAEYKALIAGLRAAEPLGAPTLAVRAH